MLLAICDPAFLYSICTDFSRSSVYFSGAILWKFVDLSPATKTLVSFLISLTSLFSFCWNVFGLCSNFMLFTMSTSPFSKFLSSGTLVLFKKILKMSI